MTLFHPWLYSAAKPKKLEMVLTVIKWTMLGRFRALHCWFKIYGHFDEWVDFAFWWSFIKKGRLVSKIPCTSSKAIIGVPGLKCEETGCLPGGGGENRKYTRKWICHPGQQRWFTPLKSTCSGDFKTIVSFKRLSDVCLWEKRLLGGYLNIFLLCKNGTSSLLKHLYNKGSLRVHPVNK